MGAVGWDRVNRPAMALSQSSQQSLSVHISLIVASAVVRSLCSPLG